MIDPTVGDLLGTLCLGLTLVSLVVILYHLVSFGLTCVIYCLKWCLRQCRALVLYLIEVVTYLVGR